MHRSRAAARLVISSLLVLGSVVGLAGPASAECIILPNEDNPEATVCVNVDVSEPRAHVSAEVTGIAAASVSFNRSGRPLDYVEVCFWSIATNPVPCLLP